MGHAAGAFQVGPTKKRAVTVPDSIEMTRLSDSDYDLGASKGHVAKFSPDGSQFLIVVEKGNLQSNTNECSVLLFRTSEVWHSPKPQVLLTMISSSNREAIQNIRWLPDNETVAFLGENSGEVPQVYTFNIRTKRLNRVTNHATPIIRYDISSDGKVIIFEAEPPLRKSVDTPETRRKGLVVSTQNLLDILTGDRYPPFNSEGEQLFVQILGHRATQVSVEDYIDHGMPISLSPDGRYAVVQVFARNFPGTWERYQPIVSNRLAEKRPKGSWVALLRYMLLDTKTASLTPLLNTPTLWRNGVTWAPDGSSVLLSAVRLPLDPGEALGRDGHDKNVYVVEVRVPGKEVLTIRQDTEHYAPFRPRWVGLNRVFLEKGFVSDSSVPAAYEKNGSVWREATIRPDDHGTAAPLDVMFQEDMNTPPKMYVTSQEGKKSLLLDLNPQFADLEFGRVERVTWNGTDGHEFWGGLFWPTNYEPGKRYPLVIQTHGFDPARFSMDGFYNPGSAARPLASSGFIVLQVNGFNKLYPGYGEGPQEAPVQMAAFEGAVDWLDGRNLITRDHVGLVGFSRTAYYVAYTLTHSKYHFAAAIMADGINAGYFQYISQGGIFMSVGDRLNGGLPWGKSAAAWLQNSPGFNLDKVDTPVRLETHAYGGGDAPSEWEWYVGLSHLNKPVELIYLPDAAHVLFKPWERIVSQQGAVDWFWFWLKGEEDSDAAKADQYARWRELRKLQAEGDKKTPLPTK